MTDAAVPPLPALGRVFREQVLVVGLAVRREAFVLLAGLALLSVVEATDHAMDGGGLTAQPDGLLFLGFLAFFAAFAVWKGEPVYRDAHLWTLPVERRRHALVKIAAGAVWVLAAVAGFLAWMSVMAILTGGSVGEDEIRRVVVAPPGPGEAGGAYRSVHWTTPAWEWAVPFTGAMVGYLLGSAAAVGVQHRMRWGAAVVLSFAAFAVLSEEAFISEIPEAFFNVVLGGPYGLDAALTGRSEWLASGIEDPVTGKEVVVWRDLPNVRDYVLATLLWLTLGAVALWAGLRRHRER